MTTPLGPEDLVDVDVMVDVIVKALKTGEPPSPETLAQFSAIAERVNARRALVCNCGGCSRRRVRLGMPSLVQPSGAA